MRREEAISDTVAIAVGTLHFVQDRVWCAAELIEPLTGLGEPLLMPGSDAGD